MKAIVVYESIFGNTMRIAEAIGKGLGERSEVTVLEVGEANYEALKGVDLLVVGGPTHMLGMSRPMTRNVTIRDMAKKGREPVSEGIGVREWLNKLPRVHSNEAAAFDTRAPRKGPISMGAAAKGIASRLEGKGYRLVAEPEGFFINDTEGPISEDEVARAAEWGRRLAEVREEAMTS